jgi:hypothetical protein
MPNLAASGFVIYPNLIGRRIKDVLLPSLKRFASLRAAFGSAQTAIEGQKLNRRADQFVSQLHPVLFFCRNRGRFGFKDRSNAKPVSDSVSRRRLVPSFSLSRLI